MKQQTLALAALVLSASFAALGCGPKTPDGMPDLQSATLTVVQDGVPLADAMVGLKSVDASNKWTSGGTTDAKGVATLVTHGQYKGVPLGKYKVTVSKTVGEGTPPPPSPIDEESARVYQEYVDSGATYEEYYVVPRELNYFDSTTLEVEVVKGKNNPTIDVGPAVREPVPKVGGVL